MAGYTDSAFRQIVKEIEPNIICFSELTSINALRYNSQKTLKLLDFSQQEQPIIAQLFGNDPNFFIEAGKKLEKLKVDGIDINMGCPAPKITKNAQGSALLKNPSLAVRIAKTLCETVKIPVSVKMRIGYSSYDKKFFLNLIKRLEKAGIKAMVVHGRTTHQAYSGTANFDPIYLAKKHLKIPVIGNGDIDSPEKAIKMLKSPDGKITLDGLMIGRASIGNPWIMREIYQKLHKKQIYKTSSITSTQSQQKTFKQKLPTIKKHLKLAIRIHGEKIGLLEMRKHLGRYISNMPNASKLRIKIMQENSVENVVKLLGSKF